MIYLNILFYGNLFMECNGTANKLQSTFVIYSVYIIVSCLYRLFNIHQRSSFNCFSRIYSNDDCSKAGELHVILEIKSKNNTAFKTYIDVMCRAKNKCFYSINHECQKRAVC